MKNFFFSFIVLCTMLGLTDFFFLHGMVKAVLTAIVNAI